MRYQLKWRFAAGLLAAAMVAAAPAFARDVPFVPTPQPVVEAMLELAEIDKNDVVYDLGSGDGRIVITAAKKYGARGVGVDIDPERIAEGRENARAAGVEDKVKFIEGDLFQVDLRPATAVTLYLLPDVNLKLRPKLLKELRPGTPVVSHSFSMGDWEPEKTVTVNGSTLYLWHIPARTAGRWEYRIARSDGRTETHRLEITQDAQRIEGTVTIDGTTYPISDGRVGIDEISFSVERTIDGRAVTQRFKGRVIDGQVAGMALLEERALPRQAAAER
ncbi:MAG TPA: class I SAM-dependent methyltransferase [Burkholderiales bacterium]